jgi:hypothetical protein
LNRTAARAQQAPSNFILGGILRTYNEAADLLEGAGRFAVSFWGNDAPKVTVPRAQIKGTAQALGAGAAVVGGLFVGSGEAKAAGALYDVGTYNELRNTRVAEAWIHHVPSRLRGLELIADFATDRMAGRELAIRLPRAEAEAVDMAARLRTSVPASAREALAWDIRDLRKYTNAPNTALQKLIDAARQLHEWDFRVR